MARVLVVDDELDVVRLIIKTLSGRGHVVQVARDSALALALAARGAFDVIVVDSDLPKVNGAEICRRLKTHARTSDIPVVMMTSAYIDILDVAAEHGPDAFLVRPFVRDVLANVIEHALMIFHGLSDAEEAELAAAREAELTAARDMEKDCSLGAGSGPGVYTREVAERLRSRRRQGGTIAPQGPSGPTCIEDDESSKPMDPGAG
jgi:CheY-like chemotaxis protein